MRSHRHSPVHTATDSCGATLLLLISSVHNSCASFFKFFFHRLFIFGTERDRVWTGEGQRERETQNRKQAPGSEPSVQSLTQGSNSRTARLWPGWSRTLNRLRHPGAPTLVLLVTHNNKSIFGVVKEVVLGSPDLSYLLRDEQGLAAWKQSCDRDNSGKGSGTRQGTWPLSLQEKEVPLLMCSPAQKRPSQVGCHIRSIGKYQARFLILHWLSYSCGSSLPLCPVQNGFILLVIEILFL